MIKTLASAAFFLILCTSAPAWASDLQSEASAPEQQGDVLSGDTANLTTLTGLADMDRFSLGLAGDIEAAFAPQEEPGFDFDPAPMDDAPMQDLLADDLSFGYSGSSLNLFDVALSDVFRTALDDSALHEGETCGQVLTRAVTWKRDTWCWYEEPAAPEIVLDENVPDEPHAALVSLDLHTYRMDPRAVNAVQKQLTLLTRNKGTRMGSYLSRSGQYIRLMKRILVEEGLPEDMAWLPLIESGFHPYAYSRSRASGQWQFIRGTGLRYGLKINFWVDERRDPVKSTRAAAKYLRDLYNEFGSWSLAMAAYNAGEGRIRSALRKSGANDFWGIMTTRYIRPETRNYVPKFIAARMIAERPELFGLDPIDYQDDFTSDVVHLDYPMSLDVIAKAAGTTTTEIKRLNPELLRWSTPPVERYALRIPRGSSERFLAEVPTIPANKRITVRVHKVRTGETVSTIARKYGVAQRMIIDYNKLSKKGFIRNGQDLIIPVAYQQN